MSLINDALKRASGAPTAASGEVGARPLQPVLNGVRRGPNPTLYGGVGIASLVIIAVGGLLLKNKTSQVQQVPQTEVQISQPTAAAILPVEQATDQPPVEQTAVTIGPIVTASPAETTAEAPKAADTLAPAISVKAESAAEPATTDATVAASSPTVAVKTRAPGELPDLKVQAIYYRLKGPTAVINGKTLRPGQQIEGARVIVIHRNSVEVEYEGALKTLVIDR